MGNTLLKIPFDEIFLGHVSNYSALNATVTDKECVTMTTDGTWQPEYCIVLHSYVCELGTHTYIYSQYVE